jgi:hypothetical protein
LDDLVARIAASREKTERVMAQTREALRQTRATIADCLLTQHEFCLAHGPMGRRLHIVGETCTS